MNKHDTRSILFALLLLFLLPLTSAIAQEEEVEDRTFSPRFYIPNSDTTLDALPLKSTSAKVIIAGVIADVTVRQVYTNEGTRAIEAKYVFPASTRAAVHYLHMRIGKRLLIADVKEKQEAQAIYDTALANGNTATLLEQMTPNVFQMNVANILPGDTIEIEMKYTELLVPEEAVYEFVYPTVVGPRYTGEGGGDEWTEGPYQHEGEDPLYDFNIEVKLTAGMPVGKVISISHPEIPIVYESPDVVYVIPNQDTDMKGNKDFILQYQLAGGTIQTGLLAYEGEDENFFLAILQPPNHPLASDIPPREYVFIMDVSGSMSGFPISVSKTLMQDLLNDLETTDRFNILFFAGGNYLFRSASVEASKENIDAAMYAINNQSGGGGTNLLSALQRALFLQGTEDYARTFLIVTDGYVSVERETFEFIRSNLGEANFFSFGIGSSVNRYLIEGMAHVGQGEPFIATDQWEAMEKADLFKTYIEKPVLTNITANIKGFDAFDIEPLNVPDIFAARPVILFGKYEGLLNGSIDIKGLSGSSTYTNTLNLNSYKANDENEALKYLWARKRIQLLDDYANLTYENDKEIIEELIDLGLRYNLLTAYTSFIVVDSTVRCDTCSSTTVNQPLPLPEGVTDLAIAYAPNALQNSNGRYSMRADDQEKEDPGMIAFPNPINDRFAVTFIVGEEDAEKEMSLSLYDVSGKMVGEVNLYALGEGTHTIYLSMSREFVELRPGTYFLTLIIDTKRRESLVITLQ